MTSAAINLLSSLNWGVFWLVVAVVVVVKEGVMGKRQASEQAKAWSGLVGTTAAAVVIAALVLVPIQLFAAPPLLSSARLPELSGAAGGAATSPESLVAQGEMIFRTRGCLGCHTIAGVSEIGTVGPELTHVGSRDLIAQTIPYSPENLRTWLTNPHEIKPGTQMPNMNLNAQELDAVVAFLDSLK